MGAKNNCIASIAIGLQGMNVIALEIGQFTKLSFKQAGEPNISDAQGLHKEWGKFGPRDLFRLDRRARATLTNFMPNISVDEEKVMPASSAIA